MPKEFSLIERLKAVEVNLQNKLRLALKEAEVDLMFFPEYMSPKMEAISDALDLLYAFFPELKKRHIDENYTEIKEHYNA